MGVCLILGLGRQNILVNINTGQALLKVEKVAHKELKTVQNDCGCKQIISGLTTEATEVITDSGCGVCS